MASSSFSIIVVNDDEEWEFLAEGGMHLVFTNGARILRINKEPPHCGDDKASSYSSSSSTTTTKNANHPAPPRHHDTAASSPYGDSIIADQLCRHLSPYTDVPMLRKLALDDHVVKFAAARLLWNDEGGSSCMLQSRLVLDDNEILAQELPDYRRGGGSSLLSSSTTATTLCLELKPKAGYIAISPLVHEDRFVKYSTTRFELQQQLYQAGMIRKRWMTNDQQSTTTTATTSNTISTSSCTTTTTSSSRSRSWYNPLDLFSGETHRIRQALIALFQNPQNNLKVWRQQHGEGGQGAHKIVSVSDTTRCGAASMRAAESVLFDDEQKNGAAPSSLDDGGGRLLDLVAAILTREPFLERVLRWQTLDVIDADGAILIYERLIHTYCHGCTATAEAMVNNVKWKEDDTTTAVTIHDLLRHSPIIHGGGASGDTSRIVQYCDEVQSLQRHLVGDQSQQDPSSHQQCLENVRTAARRILSEFQPDDCCYLLQCWLLSLGACDLSFFVTMMRRVDDGDTNNHGRSTTDNRLQTATRPGCIVYDNDHHCFEYELKCIDYDFKPAKKLRYLKEKERQINTISASPLT
jgi:Inositol-pentakisphosphate 2-kinase